MTSQTPTATGKPAQKSRRKRRRWLFVLFALGIGAVLALLLVEAAFRLFWPLPKWFADFQQAGMYAPAESGAPKLQPGYTGTLKIGSDRLTNVRINNLGMRSEDGENIPRKQPGERRVLVVGDSLVFGYGVEASEALPNMLGGGLKKLGIEATLGNGGVPGYGSRHYVPHMARLDQPFGADAFVVCGYLGNDAIDDTRPLRTVYAGLMLHGAMAKVVRTSWRMQLAFRSRAALWFEAWVFTNKIEWSPMMSLVPDPTELALLAGLPPARQQVSGLFLDVRDEQKTWAAGTPPVLPRLCTYLRESLQKAKSIAGERPIAFVVLPTSAHVDESKRTLALAEAGLDPADFERGLAQKRWLTAAREAGLIALDATTVLAAAGPTDNLFTDDGGHLSVLGNQIVGDWLAEQLAPHLR